MVGLGLSDKREGGHTYAYRLGIIKNIIIMEQNCRHVMVRLRNP